MISISAWLSITSILCTVPYILCFILLLVYILQTAEWELDFFLILMDHCFNHRQVSLYIVDHSVYSMPTSRYIFSIISFVLYLFYSFFFLVSFFVYHFWPLPFKVKFLKELEFYHWFFQYVLRKRKFKIVIFTMETDISIHGLVLYKSTNFFCSLTQLTRGSWDTLHTLEIFPTINKLEQSYDYASTVI